MKKVNIILMTALKVRQVCLDHVITLLIQVSADDVHLLRALW